MIAWVVLPDHWHCIIDPRGNDIPSLMKRIKLSFAQKYVRRQGRVSGRTWQRRYWDHITRSQEDLNRHLDYIHYNPVKHLRAESTGEYPHSSFAEYVDKGLYAPDWRVGNPRATEGEFGE